MLTATRRTWLAALAAMAVAAAATVPFRHLWEPDEPRYCQSAREMIESGDWVLPRLNGEPYGHKPPAFMWLVAAGRLAGLGWTPAGVLPSLLPFVALLLLMPAMARDLGLSRPAGELAAAFLAASPLAAIMALAARMDTLLATLFTASLWLAVRLVWPIGPAPRGGHIALWLALAVATLTKGPVVLVLFALTIGITWVAARPSPTLAPIFAGPGPLVGMAVILAWLVPAGLRGGPDYLWEILVRQSAGRMVDSFAHKEPFYFHILTYPATGLPFAVLALTVALATLRGRRSDARTLLASAMIAVLGFFSALSGKLVVYLLPLFPAAALLAADAIVRGRENLRTGLYAGAFGMILLGAVVALSPHSYGQLRPVRLLLLAAGGAMVACAMAALVALLRRQPALSIAARLTAAGLLVPAAVVPFSTHALNPTMHLAAVAAVVQGMEPEATDGFVFRMNVSGPSLYAQRIVRKLRSPQELRETLLAGRAVIVEEKAWRRVRSQLSDLTILATVFEFRTGPVLVLRAKLLAPPGASAWPAGASPRQETLPESPPRPYIHRQGPRR